MTETNSKKLRERSEIEAGYRWNIEAMYPNEDLWEADFSACNQSGEAFGRFAGHLGDSASLLLEALEEKDRIWQKLERVYVYARKSAAYSAARFNPSQRRVVADR